MLLLKWWNLLFKPFMLKSLKQSFLGWEGHGGLQFLLPEVFSKALPGRLQWHELFKLDQFTNLMNLGVVIYEAGFIWSSLLVICFSFDTVPKPFGDVFLPSPTTESLLLFYCIQHQKLHLSLRYQCLKWKPQLEGLSVKWKKSGKTRIRPQ